MSVTAAPGFAASGVSAGIRPSGRPDVALVRSLVPSVGCAMWTTNRVQAAPVTVSRRHAVFTREGADVCKPADHYPNSFVYRVNTKTLSVDQAIEVGAVPKYVAVTPNGQPQ